MTVTGAFSDGMRRVSSAPTVIAGVAVLTLLLALPLGLTLRGTLRAHLGDSLAAEQAASGVNYDWWQEFSEQSAGLETTFSPTIIGFGAVLDNISGLFDNTTRPTAIVGIAAAYAVVWLFLAGGILDRYARNRPVRAGGFFSVCGVFFFRFARLAIVAALVYYFLFGILHNWLFDRFYAWATHNTTVERNAFLLRVTLYAIFGFLLAACNMVFDYAKIRAVMEDRRSMIGALLAGFRFVWRHRVKTLGLYALNGVLFVVVLVTYAIAAPGAGTTGVSMWTGFLVGQAYLLARMWTKLIFYASQTVLFQGELAHAGYTAAPQRVWPESPAAEAISNMRR